MTWKLHKIVNNLIIGNIFRLMVSWLGQDGWYLQITNLCKTNVSHITSFNIHTSIGLTTLTHMLNGYEICINTTNYLIFNLQYFIDENDERRLVGPIRLRGQIRPHRNISVFFSFKTLHMSKQSCNKLVIISFNICPLIIILFLLRKIYCTN